MELTLITGLLFLATTSALSKNNYSTCIDKPLDAADAINSFCKQKMDLMASSYVVQMGMMNVPGRNYRVRMWSNCKPATRISRKYCQSQFFATCTRSGKHGIHVMKYGKKVCQQFGTRPM